MTHSNEKRSSESQLSAAIVLDELSAVLWQFYKKPYCNSMPI
ncbi:hypothetical protein [Gloeocapsa sp. PCC 7428]